MAKYNRFAILALVILGALALFASGAPADKQADVEAVPVQAPDADLKGSNSYGLGYAYPYSYGLGYGYPYSYGGYGGYGSLGSYYGGYYPRYYYGGYHGYPYFG